MKIAVFGTGGVGQTLAAKLSEIGHDVMMGTRDVAAASARNEPGQYGQPSFSAWQQAHQGVKLGTFEEAARHGEMLFNATSGSGALNALRLAGEPNLNGKIMIDLTNPLDFSRGMPPSLSVCNTDSLGEQIQRVNEKVKVVKALNMVTAALMVNPGLVASGDHTLFMCGNDADAKAQVATWLREWFGWRDILDLGDISSARGMEMYLPIWLRMWGALGTGMFNVKVVK